MPTPYATVSDVLRRFDAGLSIADIQAGNVIGADGPEQIRARIRSVSAEWDRDTGTPMRLRRAGSPGAPDTYEHHDAQRSASSFPLRVELDNDDVVPIDASAGDTLEIRTGRDTWEDVTSDEGDDWVLLEETGTLKIFRWLLQRVYWEAPDERYLRATYRYGALGGDRDRGGQTTLSASVDDQASTTTLPVTDASRLPYDGGIVLLPGDDPVDDEYVRVTDVDAQADDLTVVRGVNGTDAAAHASGTAVHYCPEDVRDAVAAGAAADLVRYDLSLSRQDADDLAIDPSAKLEDWAAELDRAKASFSGVRRL